jgi:hypothetical protein
MYNEGRVVLFDFCQLIYGINCADEQAIFYALF